MKKAITQLRWKIIPSKQAFCWTGMNVFEQKKVFFYKPFLRDPRVSLYVEGKKIDISPCSIEPADWDKLMRIMSALLEEREANEDESVLFDKIRAQMDEESSLTHFSEALRDDALIELAKKGLISEDEDCVDGCVMS